MAHGELLIVGTNRLVGKERPLRLERGKTAEIFDLNGGDAEARSRVQTSAFSSMVPVQHYAEVWRSSEGARTG